MRNTADTTDALPDDAPHAPNQEEQPPPPDSGLLGLVLIARYHQIPATPEGLHHQFAPAVKELGRPAVFGDQEIQLAAKSLGFRVRAAKVDLNNRDNVVLPSLCKNTYGEYFILVQIASAHDGPSASAKKAHTDNSPQDQQ